jgi:hypothetical protein
LEAISNSVQLSFEQFFSCVYSRDGSELQISASCTPFFADGGVLSGCKLQLHPADSAIVDASSDSHETVEGLAELMARGTKDRRTAYRATGYNFRTGLAIKHSMLRCHAGACPAPRPALSIASGP